MTANESRPEPTRAAVAEPAPAILPATSDDAADFFRTSFAVLVRGLSVRRHLYFDLPAAERTVRRAEARGDQAELVLVRLVPVDARHLDHEA